MMKEFDQDAEEKEQEATKEEEDQEEEEANKAVAPKIPIKPSQDEVDEHMLTHLPFRSWCPHCVRGKAKGKPHRKQTGTTKEIPTVSLDYMFMHGNQEEDEERGMPILVVKDEPKEGTGTGMVFAYAVPQKGVQPYAVKKLAETIGQLGHPEIVLKSDGEPAIVALKEAAKRERAERIVTEETPVKESKSNGGIENAIQQIQGQFRAMKDNLETRIGERLSETSAIVPWIIIHAARTLNRYHLGTDGKTAYRRWKGKEFKREVAEIGEQVMYLKAGTQGKDKFNARWERGTWLGV